MDGCGLYHLFVVQSWCDEMTARICDRKETVLFARISNAVMDERFNGVLKKCIEMLHAFNICLWLLSGVTKKVLIIQMSLRSLIERRAQRWHCFWQQIHVFDLVIKLLTIAGPKKIISRIPMLWVLSCPFLFRAKACSASKRNVVNDKGKSFGRVGFTYVKLNVGLKMHVMHWHIWPSLSRHDCTIRMLTYTNT